jgi:hypothetical protein
VAICEKIRKRKKKDFSEIDMTALNFNRPKNWILLQFFSPVRLVKFLPALFQQQERRASTGPKMGFCCDFFLLLDFISSARLMIVINTIIFKEKN